MTTHPEDAMTRERALEKAARVAEGCKMGDNSMLTGTGMWAVHDGACNEIAEAIRALASTQQEPAADAEATDEMVAAAIKQFEAKRQQCWCPECIRAGMRAALEAAARAKSSGKGT